MGEPTPPNAKRLCVAAKGPDRLMRSCAAHPPLQRRLREVPRGQTMALERFLVSHFANREPVVMRGGCSCWPAISRWNSVSFWIDGPTAPRVVPVEMDYYLDTGFKLMPLCDFVEHCLAAESTATTPAGLS